jgi:hypothetical protein
MRDAPARTRRAAPLGIAVAAATALVAAACGSDETIQIPTAPSPTGTTSTSAAPKTKTVKLFNGKTVVVDIACSVRLHISADRDEAVAAAKKLPSLKQHELDRRRDFRRFLAAHPERALTPAEYATYRSLRARYRSAVTRYNRQVRTYNRLADRFNGDLHVCKA